MRRIVRLAIGSVLALSITASLAASAYAADESVDVQITATDFAFSSSETTFAVGTPYRFILTNQGLLAHDWMIMPLGETDEDMALAMIEDDEFGAGTTTTIEFTFSEPGEYEFACHVLAHYETGMLLPITVE